MWNPQSSAITSQLASGERLLWSGQPRKGIFLKSSDIYMIPFSLLWGGFAIFWEYGVFQTGNWFFMLWGVPFVAVGVYMIIGRFFVDAWQRSKMHYGVTNERIIITHGLFSKQVKSLNLKTLTDVTLSERSNGSGTITFGPQDPTAPYGSASPFVSRDKPSYPIFDSIQNAKQVYEIIRGAQRA